MDKIDTEIRFAGMAEERLRREDPHYQVWSFTDDDDVTALYLGRVDMNGEPVERYDRTRTILAFDGDRVFAKWHGGRLFEMTPSIIDGGYRSVCEMAWRTPVRGRPPCQSVDRRVEEKSGNEYLESPVG